MPPSAHNDQAQSPERNFAANMRTLREALGWNQSQLARRLTERGLEGFHQTTVSRIEKGQRPVRLGEATVIADVLSVPMEQLVGRSEDVILRGDVLRRKKELEIARLQLASAGASFVSAQRQLIMALGGTVHPAGPADTYPHTRVLSTEEQQAVVELVGLAPEAVCTEAPF